MADIKDIYWVAGLLEGEGCFSKRSPGHNPVIQLIMTDKDIVIRAAKILGCHKVTENKSRTSGGKSAYRTVLYGRRAISWMMTLWAIMGSRRKSKIEECISVWKNKKKTSYPERKSYSRGANVVWVFGGVPSLTT